MGRIVRIRRVLGRLGVVLEDGTVHIGNTECLNAWRQSRRHPDGQDVTFKSQTKAAALSALLQSP